MQSLRISFSYKHAFRFLLWSNAVLMIIGTILLTSPARAINIEVIAKVDNTTSYSLKMKSTDIVYIECAGMSEAKLSYLRNQQAVTCP